jgi:hypothetical protein
MRAAFVLDPCAWSPTGHHLQFDLALIEELSRAGVDTWLYTHRDASGAAAGHPGVVRHFSVHPGMPLSSDPVVGDLETYLVQNRGFLDDLRSFSAQVDLDDALLVFPNVLHHMLFGLAEWLGVQTKSGCPRVVLVFPGYSGYDGDTATVNWIYALYRHGFNALTRSAGADPILLALTPEQAAEYSLLAGRPVGVPPYPTSASLWRGSLDRPPGRPLRVVFLGGSGSRKGFNLLPEIVARSVAARSDIQFAIQVSADGVAPPPVEVVEALVRAGPSVRLIDGYTDQEAYFRSIVDSDLVLLPYQSPMYRTGSSAVFEDACYLGRPCVVPPNTSMAAALSAGRAAGVIAAGRAADDLAAALLGAIENLDSLATAAAVASEVRRTTEGMDRFVRSLLDTPALTRRASSPASGRTS